MQVDSRFAVTADDRSPISNGPLRARPGVRAAIGHVVETCRPQIGKAISSLADVEPDLHEFNLLAARRVLQGSHLKGKVCKRHILFAGEV